MRIEDSGSTHWTELDQSDLDREYSPSSLAFNMDGEIDRWVDASVNARVALAKVRCVRSYGSGDERTLDIFRSVAPGLSPAVIFLHGGYWTALSKEHSSFLAPGFHQSGIAFVAANYPLAPVHAMDEIVTACRDAINYVIDHADAHGIDPKRVFVCGHSAGAHLAMMAVTGNRPRRVAGVIAVSGIFDLEPLRHTYVNELVRLDEAGAARNSPLLHVTTASPPALIAYTQYDTNEFRRQSHEMHQRWLATGLSSTEVDMDAEDHFTAISQCCDATTPLGALVRAMIERTNGSVRISVPLSSSGGLVRLDPGGSGE